MSLSDRIRPNSEAAPWVVEEVKQMEARIKRLEEAVSWRPIESAPHDMTWVIGYDEKDGECGTIIFDRVVEPGESHEEQCHYEWTDGMRRWEPTHWMPLPEPPKAKEVKPRHPQSSERRCAVIQFRTIAEAISAVKHGSTVCWKTGAYQLRQDKNGKWFIHCSITNDWASLFWADGVTSSYKPEDFFNAGSL